ncbi:MAG: hypothetical protein FJX57_24350, partial [Alphaproteobacteria bacterium]|nr:hypothetical protein [Alphaproteobacteria bacterium]
MSSAGSVERGTPARRAAIHPIVPWLLAFAVLLTLPWLTRNAYHHYILIVICINVILAVGL